MLTSNAACLLVCGESFLANLKAGDTWIAVKVGNQIQGAAQPMDSHNQAKGNGYQPQPADDSDIPF